MDEKYTDHAEFEPSKLESYEICPASWYLGRDIKQEATENQTRGTYLHALMAMLGETPVSKVIAIWDDNVDRGLLSETDHGYLMDCYENLIELAPIDKWNFEEKVTMLDDFFNVITWGTVDAWCRIDNLLYVVDFKFGGTQVDVEDNLQLQTYSLALMAKESAQAAQLFIFQPMRKSFKTAYLSNNRSHTIKARIQSIIDRCKQDQIIFNISDKCNWCNFKAQCPVLQKKKNSLIVRDDYTPTPENLAKMLPVVKQAKKQISLIEKQAKDVLAKHPKAITGWKLVQQRGNREISDANGLYNFCAELLEHSEIMEYCTFTLGKLEDAYARKYKSKIEKGTLKQGKQIFNDGVNQFCRRKSDKIILKEEK